MNLMMKNRINLTKSELKIVFIDPQALQNIFSKFSHENKERKAFFFVCYVETIIRMLYEQRYGSRQGPQKL